MTNFSFCDIIEKRFYELLQKVSNSYLGLFQGEIIICLYFRCFIAKFFLGFGGGKMDVSTILTILGLVFAVIASITAILVVVYKVNPKKEISYKKFLVILLLIVFIITLIILAVFYIIRNWGTTKGGDPSSSIETSYQSSSSSSTESTENHISSSLPIYVSPINVTLEPNGGSISYDPITVYYGEHYPELKEASRDYYKFEGWYTSEIGGYKVKEGDIVDNTNSHTLYAHWIENDLSDWVLVSDMPSGAKIEEEKWEYTLTESIETFNSYEPGWSQIGSYWKQIKTGNNTYAIFPSNSGGKEYCNPSDQFYNTYNNNAYTAFETETTKREITNEQIKSYIYYHWVYPLSGNHSETNRIIGEYKGKPIYNNDGVYHGTADIWESFEGGYVEYNQKYDAYVITGHSTYSYCWNGGIPVYIQTYTDYEKIYQYEREIIKESTTEVTEGGAISNVQKKVKYREK